MKMKHCTLYILVAIIVAICLLPSTSLHAQQRPQYSQYMNNQFMLNPALAGSSEVLDARGGARLQWSGFKDAPRSIYATIHKPLGLLAPNMRGKTRGESNFFHGIGALVMSDVTGPTSRTSVYGAYAYNQKLTKTLRASLGFFGGIQHFGLDDSKTIYSNNSIASRGNISKFFPDAAVGLWVYNKRFWAGGSINQIFKNQFSTRDLNSGVYVAGRHLFASTGMQFWMTKDWAIIPSVMVKWVNPAPATIDLNVKFRYQNTFFCGTSFRSTDAIVFMLGLTHKKYLDFGYSYDAVYNGIARYQGGSHELFLGYRMQAKRRNYNPSDFWK